MGGGGVKNGKKHHNIICEWPHTINNEYILGMCSISIRFFIGLDYVSVCKNHLDLIIVKNVQSFKNSREVKTFKSFRNKRCLNCRIFFKKQTFLQ